MVLKSIITVQFVAIVLLLLVFRDTVPIKIHTQSRDTLYRIAENYKKQCKVEKEIMRTKRDWKCWARR